MRLRAVLVLATVALGTAIAAPGTAAAAPTTEPFCDTVFAVVAGNGWSVFAPTAVHRTGRSSQACYMKYGDRGGGVHQLQYALRYCYGANIGDTGYFGATTKAAVERVQRLHGITVDGVYGPRTFKAMRWRLFKAEGINSIKCYRPFVSRTVTANPPPGSFSPYCAVGGGRYAGNGWWAWLPATVGRTTGTAHFACYLKPGDRGYGVRVLQNSLRDCYRASLPATGYYGAQTKATVERVQRLHGIRVDGIYGPATMKAMVWRLTNNLHGASQRCYSPF
jgi:peptidoglycan hydrolase-like protein with peptidoglycan-binding domain